MIRRRVAMVLAIVIACSGIGIWPSRVAASAPEGSVSWTVDHEHKTITALVQIQIYSGCSGNPQGAAEDRPRACWGRGSQVTQFLADKIKRRAEAYWNKGYKYRCYTLMVIVDVTLASDELYIDTDRIPVRIDPSPVNIRSWVRVSNNNDNWKSNDPSARLEAETIGLDPTTWQHRSTWWEGPQDPGYATYAHEVGHILGLDDQYHDVKDPQTGKLTSVPNKGAPIDLMSTGFTISQETIDRVVERNRDRLFDRDGNQVDLDDLVCDLRFEAHFKASGTDYHASHQMNSLGQPPCSFPPTTASEGQTIAVQGDTVEINLVESKEAELGYALVPTFDVLTVQNGMSGGGRSNAAVGLFDIPVKVDLVRTNAKPATGDIPMVLDFASKDCTTGGGSPPPVDCGARSYRTWLAISVTGSRNVWPVGSSLPIILKDLGYQSPRLDLLYRNCRGQSPRPAEFIEDSSAIVKRGELPTLEAIRKIAEAWIEEGTDGKVEIDGYAALDRSEIGSLTQDVFSWTLVLCPLNREGKAPPTCT